jgi:hypothetical protein
MSLPRESDLYEPVAEYLRSCGYEVRGEVRNVDIVARRDGELVAVELKRAMGLSLILQAVDRQRTVDSVYVAVPAKREGSPIPNFRRVSALIRRLELGLILVHARASGPTVEVRIHPAPWKKRRKPRERRYIIREFDGRTGDRNRGGSATGARITAYREQAVHIACALARTGNASPAALRSLGTDKKTGNILQRNVYGWFERVERGVYRLHPAGEQALSRFPDLVKHYSDAVDEAIAKREE